MPPPSFFAKNLAALNETDPALAERLRVVPFPAARVRRAASGHATVAVTGEEGGEVLLHSRNDPVAEAEAQTARLPLEGVSGYVVYGLGAGYHVSRLLARAPRAARIAVFECFPENLRVALDLHDWSEAIRTGRIFFLVDLPKPAIVQRLEKHTLSFFGKTEVFAHPASWAAFPGRYGAARRVVEEFFAFARMNLHTLAKLSRVTMLNVCLNLSHYVVSPGVKDLAGAARGYPAVLVAGGPSLVKNVGLLPEAARGAVVVAVPTVFRTLLARDIVPDFVTTLDYHKISAKYFEGLEGAPPVTLVCDPKVSYAVVDTYPGPKRFTNHPFLRDVLGDVAPDKGTIRWGSTVAHLSLYLAEHLGADPIILVGQDLCYPYGVTHMPGTPIHENWVPEFNRFSTFETKEWETLLRLRPILRRARDVEGNSVYTDEQMFSYLVRFEEDFARSPARIIDATEGGLPKAGTERMTLAEAIHRHCARPFPRERLASQVPPDAAPPDTVRRRAAERIRETLSELAAAGDYYREMAALLDDVQVRLDRGENPSPAIRAVRREAERINRFMRAHKMVVALAQPEEFRRVKADLEMATVKAEGAARQRLELARDRAYMEGLKGACETLRAFLSLPLERLEGREGEAGRPLVERVADLTQQEERSLPAASV